MVHDYKQINGGSGQVAADEIELLKKIITRFIFSHSVVPIIFQKLMLFLSIKRTK